ncbi:MAG: hypothetical protein D3923_15935, partial [Candidatus Electrothrix sp. AR3]|nr:hypothetical protein [Candidatus Electrothrix sp. AR3]
MKISFHDKEQVISTNNQERTTMRKLILTFLNILILIPVATFAAEKVTLCHKGKNITIAKAAV